jgi:monolysocardiolipin acyltransferase
MDRLLSTLTVTTIGLTCKAFLNLGFCSSVTVRGLPNFLKVLEDEERVNAGRGVITGEHICSGLIVKL